MKNKTNSSLFEQHGITYCEINGVFIPNLELPEQKEIGQFGLQHEIWLKTHHHLRHSLLLGSGELNEYLYQVDKTSCRYRISSVSINGSERIFKK